MINKLFDKAKDFSIYLENLRENNSELINLADELILVILKANKLHIQCSVLNTKLYSLGLSYNEKKRFQEIKNILNYV